MSTSLYHKNLASFTFYILRLLGNPPAPLAAAQDAGFPGYRGSDFGKGPCRGREAQAVLGEPEPRAQEVLRASSWARYYHEVLSRSAVQPHLCLSA